MAKCILAFQHNAWEKPGRTLLNNVAKCNASLDIVKLWKQEVPPLSRYDGLIVLRGTVREFEPNRKVSLEQEKMFISKWINDDRPFLGLSLGHLLLASVFGATIGTNYCASIGFVDGFLTHKGKAHPLLQNIPTKLPMFKWHNQTMVSPIPGNIDILATSSECQFEAISIPGRPHIVGMQFENNAATSDDIETYLQKDRKWLSSFTGKYIDPVTILADARKLKQTMSKHFAQLFSNFIKMI